MLEENEMRFKSMRQLAEVLDRSTLKQGGIKDSALIDQIIIDMEAIQMLEISATVPKLNVNLKFIEGPHAGQVIEIDPQKSLVVFGCLD